MTTQVIMPQMGESITEGTIVRWIKKLGDAVERDEPLFEISTDKVDAEIPSPATGVLTHIGFNEGDTVPVNDVIATISEVHETAIPEVPPSIALREHSRPVLQTPVEKAAVGSDSSSNDPLSPAATIRSSPVVRRIAREASVDIAQISGSGVRGRVTKSDILRYIEQRAPVSSPTPDVVRSSRADRVEKLSPMRKKIAEHMVFSRRTSAHVHSVFQVNFSAIERLRRDKKAEYDRTGVKLTYMAFIASVVANALQRHPVINASIEEDHVIYKGEINLGIAVALEHGLIVPVIKNADEKTLLGLSRAIADVAGRARTKRLQPDEVQGGTFTITNPGQSGAQFGLPIINQPQVAILGVGTIERRPVVVGDAIGIRTAGYLTLGYDHRLVDGADADRFMSDVKNDLERFDHFEV